MARGTDPDQEIPKFHGSGTLFEIHFLCPLEGSQHDDGGDHEDPLPGQLGPRPGQPRGKHHILVRYVPAWCVPGSEYP